MAFEVVLSAMSTMIWSSTMSSCDKGRFYKCYLLLLAFLYVLEALQVKLGTFHDALYKTILSDVRNLNIRRKKKRKKGRRRSLQR